MESYEITTIYIFSHKLIFFKKYQGEILTYQIDRCMEHDVKKSRPLIKMSGLRNMDILYWTPYNG